MSDVKSFILKNWENTTRYNPDDNGTLIGLPKPYTVPSIADHFQEMYYWDTYFSNRGLIICGRVDQAINNVENMFSLIDRYGCMLNGNRVYYLNNSQPPFLSLMVKDIYDATKDKNWLKTALSYLEKEYNIWQTSRNTEIGLNQYSCNNKGAIAEKKYEGYIRRIGKRPEGYSDDELSCHYVTVCESGWDITPRFGFEAKDYVEVDLNALLFALEKNIGDFTEELGFKGSDVWYKRAQDRKNLMEKYMLKDGIFYDYDFKKKTISDQFTCASFYPMFVGMLDDAQAAQLAKNLYRLEAEYGITADEKKDFGYKYQWHYPNGWAPHQDIVMRALSNYGYSDDALRVAEKYVRIVEKNFAENHNLWEKYNVVTGGIDIAYEGSGNDSAMPPMMGWTAGAYLDALKYIEEH